MKKTLFLPCIIASIIFMPHCTKKPEAFQGVVTFISGTLKINNQDAAVGSRVQQNDILATAENSLAVIQIAETAVIMLHSDTEMKFDNLVNKKEQAQVVSLSLNKGSTFHKVLVKGTDYSVKTQTAVASVRGTSFEVKIDGAKNRISLLNGKVHIEKVLNSSAENKESKESKINDLKEIDLTPGQSLEITAAKIEQPVSLDKIGLENLKLMDSIATVPNVEKTIPLKDNSKETEKQNGQDSVTQKVEVISESVKNLILKQGLSNIESIGDKKLEEKPKSKKEIYIEKLNVIKEENDGKLDKITLRNGGVIMGMIIDRGAKYKVKTPDGIIEILPRDIESQIITH